MYYNIFKNSKTRDKGTEFELTFQIKMSHRILLVFVLGMHPVIKFGVFEPAPPTMPEAQVGDILKDRQKSAMLHRYREFTGYAHSQMSFQKRMRWNLIREQCTCIIHKNT